MNMIQLLGKVWYHGSRRLTKTLFHLPEVCRAKIVHSMGYSNHIRQTISGAAIHQNDSFAIFLIWQPNGLSWSVRNALDVLNEKKINVVAVVNHELSPEVSAEILPLAHTIVIRDNAGFDMGGFKDGTAVLSDKHSPSRVIYLNDSTYFFREGLDDLIDRLITSTAGACTAFENWEMRYHMQSFCYSVSGEVFRSKEFQNFWRSYLPVNSRLWAIHAGEIALTQSIRQSVDIIDVIYRASDLEGELASKSLAELRALNNYLPVHLRLNANLFTARSDTRAIAREIRKQVTRQSQIHSGGFLFRKFFHCPLMKRDLLYRLQYDIYEVETILDDVGHEGQKQKILMDMRRKGQGTELTGIRRRKFDVGLG